MGTFVLEKSFLVEIVRGEFFPGEFVLGEFDLGKVVLGEFVPGECDCYMLYILYESLSQFEFSSRRQTTCELAMPALDQASCGDEDPCCSLSAHRLPSVSNTFNNI